MNKLAITLPVLHGQSDTQTLFEQAHNLLAVLHRTPHRLAHPQTAEVVLLATLNPK